MNFDLTSGLVLLLLLEGSLDHRAPVIAISTRCWSRLLANGVPSYGDIVELSDIHRWCLCEMSQGRKYSWIV